MFAIDQTPVQRFHCQTRVRGGSPAPESTDQLCTMESIWHSGLTLEPRGEPSSK
jgi:hypothetical protein